MFDEPMLASFHLLGLFVQSPACHRESWLWKSANPGRSIHWRGMGACAKKASTAPFKWTQWSLSMLHNLQSRIRGISNGKQCGCLFTSQHHMHRVERQASLAPTADPGFDQTMATSPRIASLPAAHQNFIIPSIGLMHTEQQCKKGTMSPLSS